MNAHTDPWPDDVVARYLTVAGATVDLTGDALDAAGACTGCKTTFADSAWRAGNRARARQWAQEHAEKCRALPRPTA